MKSHTISNEEWWRENERVYVRITNKQLINMQSTIDNFSVNTSLFFSIFRLHFFCPYSHNTLLMPCEVRHSILTGFFFRSRFKSTNIVVYRIFYIYYNHLHIDFNRFPSKWIDKKVIFFFFYFFCLLISFVSLFFTFWNSVSAGLCRFEIKKHQILCVLRI